MYFASLFIPMYNDHNRAMKYLLEINAINKLQSGI